jgi:ATP-dependent Clp protease adapter protein ClpS
MSDVGVGVGSKSKGGVKVGVKEREETKVAPKEKEDFEVEWRVLLHNDDVHTFDYVSRKLAEVREGRRAGYDGDIARAHVFL